MTNDKYKIALTGPSGAGKTTLANYITEILDDVKYIQGSAGGIIPKNLRKGLKEDFNYKKDKGHRYIIKKSHKDPDFGLAYQQAVLAGRFDLITQNENFVTDRSFVDNIVFFLLQCSSQLSTSVTGTFIEQVLEDIKESGLTHLIYVKTCNPFSLGIENNNSRVDNWYFQHAVVDQVFNHVWFNIVAPAIQGIELLVIDKWDLDWRMKNIKAFLSK